MCKRQMWSLTKQEPFLCSIHIDSSLLLIVSHPVARSASRIAHSLPVAPNDGIPRGFSSSGFVQLVFIGLKPGNIFIAISHPAEAGGN